MFMFFQLDSTGVIVMDRLTIIVLSSLSGTDWIVTKTVVSPALRNIFDHDQWSGTFETFSP